MLICAFVRFANMKLFCNSANQKQKGCRTISGSQLLQNTWIIKQTVVLVGKFWRKYQSVSYLFSSTQNMWMWSAKTNTYLNKFGFNWYMLKVSRSKKKIVEPQILPKNKRTNSFFLLNRVLRRETPFEYKKRIRSFVFWANPRVLLKKTNL